MNTYEARRCEKRERDCKKDAREETWMKSEERRYITGRVWTIEKEE